MLFFLFRNLRILLRNLFRAYLELVGHQYREFVHGSVRKLGAFRFGVRWRQGRGAVRRGSRACPGAAMIRAPGGLVGCTSMGLASLRLCCGSSCGCTPPLGGFAGTLLWGVIIGE